MTKKQKQLLVKALCGYLPYGLKICKEKPSFLKKDGMHIQDVQGIDLALMILLTNTSTRIEDMKPYLRPMSSMTEKERAKYLKACDKETDDALAQPRYSGVDWLNEHHFDYRGLIGMGLALEAEEGMYDSKTNEYAEILQV